MQLLRSWLPISVMSVLFLCVVNPVHAVVDQSSIGPGDKVTIKFNLTVPETRLAIQDNVSEYVPGQHQLLPALEGELMGMKAGDRKHVEFNPEQAFGRYDAEKKMTVARDRVPEEAKVGDVYRTAHGQPFMVGALNDQSAVVDFNHPLAGKRVVFDVQILKVERQEAGSSSAPAETGPPDATIATLTGVTVEKIDQQNRQLRVRTQEGENWSLVVTRTELLTGVQEGDRVSLEVNSDDRVKNIIKTEKK